LQTAEEAAVVAAAGADETIAAIERAADVAAGLDPCDARSGLLPEVICL